MAELRIDVWSDIACPWCYVGKRRLEAAMARLGDRGAIKVVWRAFELDLTAPREQPADLSYAARLARKYRTGIREAEEMIRRMTEVAATDGLDLHFEKIRPGNTLDAHRVLHLAGDRGVQDAAKERLLRAYLTEGEAIGDHAVLARLSADVGLDNDEVRAMLTSDAYVQEVRADEREARGLGIDAVPFFVVGARFGIAGAQPAEVLLEVLTKAQSAEYEPGASCGPDGCD